VDHSIPGLTGAPEHRAIEQPALPYAQLGQRELRECVIVTQSRDDRKRMLVPV
jgi:hypothetical protein